MFENRFEYRSKCKILFYGLLFNGLTNSRDLKRSNIAIFLRLKLKTLGFKVNPQWRNI